MTTDDRPSRSALKRAVQKFEQTVLAVIKLTQAEFKAAPLCDEWREEFVLIRGLKACTARQRQIRHLTGVLKREPELVASLDEYLEHRGASSQMHTRIFHDLEHLRDRICDPATSEEAIREAGEQFEALDLRALSRLASSVIQSSDKRASREIFKRLRKASD